MNSTEKLIELLRNKNATFCTAESCTGGNIST
ncbi:MAG: CinA family protein, partial [Bacteroidales bacterium]|nr:CinA family protein [Bacteroidales bacterium]